MRTLLATTVTGTTNTSNGLWYIDPVHSGRLRTMSEDFSQFRVPFAGTLRKLRVNILTNGRTTTSTVRLRKNGANGNMAVAIPAGTTGTRVDTVNSDILAAGDLISFTLQNGNGTTTLDIHSIQMEFEAADGRSRYFYCYNGLQTLSLFQGATLWGPVAGHARTVVNAWQGSDTSVNKTYMAASAEVSNPRIFVNTNTLNADGVFDLMKNGSTTGVSITVAAGVTGSVLGTGTVDVAPGDYLSWRYSSTRTSGGMGYGHLELSFVDKGDEQWQMSAATNEASNAIASAPATRYANLFGYNAHDVAMPVSLVAEQDMRAMRVDILTGANFNAGTGTLQENGTDTLLSVSSPGGNSYASEATPVKITAGQVLRYREELTSGNNSQFLLCITTAFGPDSADMVAGGPLATVTLAPVNGTAAGFQVASGPIGTITLVPLQGGNITNAVGEGPVGTIRVVPPRNTIEYTTQLGAMFAATADAELRSTQAGLTVTARITANERVTQMGLLVIAKGGETPLVPDPLKLQDGGRQQLLTQRLVNMYVESTPEGPTPSARFQRPGLYSIAAMGEGPVRATFLHQGFRYTVSGDLVWRDSVNIGTVPAEGELRWAISDEEVVIVAGDRAYYVTTLDVSRINDPDLPYVRDVKFLAGRFVYFAADTSGMYYYSKVNDAKNIDGLSFASAEASPDRIIGAEVMGEGMAIFGTNTTEWHYPTLDPNNPFQRSQGRTYDKGCLAIQTVQRADNDLHFVGNDRMVYRAAQVPAKVSTHSVDDRLRRQTEEEFASNSAFTITFGGHVFYVLNIVGQGTWALNVGQKLWAEWKSWGKDRFRVSVADADGFMGDALSGRIMGFDGKKMVDLDGDPIERIVSVWLPLKSGTMRNFNLALHTQQGVGLLGADLAKGGDPKVEMRFSDHMGQNWTNWMEGNLGKHGVRGKEALAQWTSLGTFPSPGRAFEFRCTDPVEFTPFQVSFNEWMP